VKYASVLDVFKQVLSHEKKVTAAINKLYALASKENDYATQVALQWFITEQVKRSGTRVKSSRRWSWSAIPGRPCICSTSRWGAGGGLGPRRPPSMPDDRIAPAFPREAGAPVLHPASPHASFLACLGRPSPLFPLPSGTAVPSAVRRRCFLCPPAPAVPSAVRCRCSLRRPPLQFPPPFTAAVPSAVRRRHLSSRQEICLPILHFHF